MCGYFKNCLQTQSIQLVSAINTDKFGEKNSILSCPKLIPGTCQSHSIRLNTLLPLLIPPPPPNSMPVVEVLDSHLAG